MAEDEILVHPDVPDGIGFFPATAREIPAETSCLLADYFVLESLESAQSCVTKSNTSVIIVIRMCAFSLEFPRRLIATKSNGLGSQRFRRFHMRN